MRENELKRRWSKDSTGIKVYWHKIKASRRRCTCRGLQIHDREGLVTGSPRPHNLIREEACRRAGVAGMMEQRFDNFSSSLPTCKLSNVLSIRLTNNGLVASQVAATTKGNSSR
jgi:hypothetical protein